MTYRPLQHFATLLPGNDDEAYFPGQNDVIWQHLYVSEITHLATP